MAEDNMALSWTLNTGMKPTSDIGCGFYLHTQTHIFLSPQRTSKFERDRYRLTRTSTEAAGLSVKEERSTTRFVRFLSVHPHCCAHLL